MSLEFDINLTDFHKELGQVASNIEEAEKAAVSEATLSYYATSTNELTKGVYQPEIDRGKNGRPKWRRKYALRRGEKYTISTDGKSGQIFTDPTSPAAKPIRNWPGGYGQKRHESEKRPAPWRRLAVQNGRQRAINRLRAAFKARMNHK